jgi:hypothetical protein
MLRVVLVYPIVGDSLSLTSPLGDATRRSSAAKTPRFVEEVRGDEPELASYLRIEERELEAGELN